jgi:hypothetical protein
MIAASMGLIMGKSSPWAPPETITYPVASLADAGERIDIWGPDGNAGTIMGIGTDWLKQIDRDHLAPELRKQMMAGTYEELLATFDKWFDTELHWQYDNREQ